MSGSLSGEQMPPTEQPEQAQPLNWRQQLLQPVRKLVRNVDSAIPNIRTHDGVAYSLARNTPRALVICLGLMLLGVIASRLGLWVEGFLWGIPTLGAFSLGLGLWLWSSNVLLWPQVSVEARDVLRRAVRLQSLILVAGSLAMLYFLGMAVQWW